MKLNSKAVAGFLATTAVAYGVAVHAAEPSAGCEGKGPGMMGERMKMMGDPAARVEKHMTHFKSELKITPEQEPLWQAFAEKVKANAGQCMKAMREKAQQPMTAPERMTQMTNVMKERLAAMESANESFKRLYDALTPEQKAVADKHGAFGGHMERPMGKPGGAGPMGQGGAPAEHSHK